MSHRSWPARASTEPKWRRYLRFWRRDPIADVDDELRFHFETLVADFVAGGMPRDVADEEARKRFGDTERVRQTLHDITRNREATMRHIAWIDTIRQDFQYAFRQLVRNPGFATVAVITLALGIGANSAIFSVVYSVLLRPLPYANADRLYSLRERNGPRDTQGMAVTYGNFGTWAARARQFEAFGAISGTSFTLTGQGDPQRISAFTVSAGYWRVEYIPPVLGRYFTANEDTPGAPHVVVLSNRLWESTFSADRSIVGRSITLSGVPYTVIGVAAAEYELSPQSAAAWVPMALTSAALAEHSDHEISVIGLVRRGVDPKDAIAELTQIETQLAVEYPHSYFDGGIVAAPLSEAVVGEVRPIILLLAGAVGLVLLIACGNVMSLLLARAAVRHRELAIRGAIGAGRTRIVAQLLTESLMLAAIGGVVGLAIAAGGVHFLVTMSPPGIPRLQDASLNGPVLLFTSVIGVVCSILFGLVPALRATRFDLQQALRDGGRDATGGGRERLRGILITAEVAVALVLLVGAGLLVRSAIHTQQVAPGFDPHNLLAVAASLPKTRYPTDEAVSSGFQEIQRAVAALPGVRSAALISRIPIGNGGFDCAIRREGVEENESALVSANVRSASANYFGAMAIPILRGRAFTSADLEGGPRVVMINRTLAHLLFGDADPIGRRVSSCASDGDSHQVVWREIVGVTGDIHARGLVSGVGVELYLPNTQFVQNPMTLAIRGDVPVQSLAPAVRHAIATVDPLLAATGFTTMDGMIARTMATPRFMTLLLLMLGVTGLALAVVGIYGVISFFVTQRAHEIGIRMALGADANRVLLAVIREGVSYALGGVLLGLALSSMLTRFIASMLFGVSARDPATFVGVALLLILVAAFASLIPARRATTVDPLAALRSA